MRCGVGCKSAATCNAIGKRHDWESCRPMNNNPLLLLNLLDLLLSNFTTQLYSQMETPLHSKPASNKPATTSPRVAPGHHKTVANGKNPSLLAKQAQGVLFQPPFSYAFRLISLRGEAGAKSGGRGGASSAAKVLKISTAAHHAHRGHSQPRVKQQGGYSQIGSQ